MREIVDFEEQYTGSASITPPKPTVGYLDFLSDQVAARLVDDPAFVENLKAKIKVNDRIDEWLEEQEQQNSPFGPVFIADLQPDKYSKELDKELERLARIKPIEGDLFT